MQDLGNFELSPMCWSECLLAIIPKSITAPDVNLHMQTEFRDKK